MEKRGVGHIEVILSFIIFIGAVGSIMYFFGPSPIYESGSNRIDYIQEEMDRNLSVDVVRYGIKINNTGGRIMIGNPEGVVALPIKEDNMNLLVRDASGMRLPSKKTSGEIYFGKNWNENEFVYVDMCQDIKPSVNIPTTSPGENKEFYTIASVLREKIVSENKIEIMKDRYYADYNSLKVKMGLSQVDFGFSFSFNDGTKIEANKSIPTNREVFVQSSEIEVIRNNGEREFAQRIIKTW